MKVLVTGHRGYIGPVMLRLFKEAGHEVVGLDTGYFAGCDFTEEGDLAARSIVKDIRDIDPKDLDGVNGVVHLAALSNDPLGAIAQPWTEDINFRGTVHLAEIARKAGVSRFIYASSCSMYGAAGEGPVDETSPLMPLTAYARSKVQSERALLDLATERFSPVFLRNATAYGVSSMLRVDIVLNNLVGWAHTTGEIVILSDGTPWRPIVHIEDISRAALASLEAPRDRIHGEAFNVGADEENYQVRDIADIVASVVHGCRIVYRGKGEPDPRSYQVSFRKIHATLPDFRTRWSAQRGAEELIRAYRAAGLTREDFEGRRYIRLKQLQYLMEQDRLDGTLRWST